MKGKRNVFWGMALLLGAVALLLGKFGYLEGIGFWSILFDICLAAILLGGFARRSFGTILFSLAFLVIVNDKLLGLEAITPWPVLGAALLGTIGLNLLFPGFGRHRPGHHLIQMGNGKSGRIEEYDRDGTRVCCENTFGDSVKYVSGEIEEVELENTFGTLQVYFTEAQPVGGSARIQLESSFGSMVLYVPASWKVKMNIDTAFGNAEESGRCSPEEGNVVQIGGSVNFGSLEVVYV